MKFHVNLQKKDIPVQGVYISVKFSFVFRPHTPALTDQDEIWHEIVDIWSALS